MIPFVKKFVRGLMLLTPSGWKLALFDTQIRDCRDAENICDLRGEEKKMEEWREKAQVAEKECENHLQNSNWLMFVLAITE